MFLVLFIFLKSDTFVLFAYKSQCSLHLKCPQNVTIDRNIILFCLKMICLLYRRKTNTYYVPFN